MDDRLTEKGFWLYKNAVRIEALAEALSVLDESSDLNSARNTLKIIRDSYALSSWPGGLRDESTDHLL